MYVITVVPPLTPITIPKAGSIVATAGVLLLHVPPVTTSAKVLVADVHSWRTPLIAAGNGATATMVEVVQPAAVVYVITAVPEVPLTISPLPGPVVVAVATAGVELLQVPPVSASVNVIEDPPEHRPLGPDMAAGSGYTVATTVAGVPQPLLYVTTVVPVNTPPNRPVVALMVPIAGTLLLQVPPVAASDNVVVLPMHTAGVPAIAPGLAFTVTATLVALVAQVQLLAVNVYTPALAATTPVTPVLNAVGVVIAVPPVCVQAYVVAPVAAPVSVRLAPLHTGLGDAVAVTAVG